jgi:signal transduction histidine kinase
MPKLKSRHRITALAGNMKNGDQLAAYKLVFANMANPSCIDKLVFIDGKPVDYIILDINKSFEAVTGLTGEAIRGKKASQVYGINPPAYLDKFARVIETGEPETFEDFFPAVNKHFRITVSKLEKNFFTSSLYDITDSKFEREANRRTEERLRSIVSILQKKYASAKEMLDSALEEAIALTRSKIGYIYHYSEDTCEFSLNSWSKEVLPECRVAQPRLSYDLAKTGLWGEAVRQRKVIVDNDFSKDNPLHKGLPAGHVRLTKFLTVPIFCEDKIVGVVGVANKETDYDELDALQLQLLMEVVWKNIDTIEANEELNKIEWMLSNSNGEILPNQGGQIFGDPVSMNRNGLIKKYLGKELLDGMVGDYLDLLNTSSVIYEATGAYAHVKLVSAWCRLLDVSSRKLCGQTQIQDIMNSGKWLWHNSFWNECCEKVVENGCSFDVSSKGGIRIYAVPIFSKGRTIGAACFGYGSPPVNPEQLREIAEKFKISFDELMAAAKDYKSRPAYIIEMAKKRLNTIARLIGSIVETRETENQLRHAMKMESIGRLAGGVAHDFNNMLGVIMGHAEMAMLESEDNSLVVSDLENIMSAAKRSADLTQQLLAFARKQAILPKVLDLNSVVSGMLKMLRRLIGENLELKFKLCESRMMVKIDPAQLDQILVNLVINAREAVSANGKIIIETSVFRIADKDLSGRLGLAAGNYALLSVSDNGCGMAPEVLDQIFEPFFTTRPEGRGTGLGLSTVYGIVQQNSGVISAYSEEGRGTTIKIYLPLVNENAENGEGSRIYEELPMGRETILLVEDDKKLLKLATSMLMKLGYEVLAVDNPVEAVEISRKASGAIDLVLTDVVMPGLNGSQMYEQIATIRPGIRCLFMSGYTADIIAHHGQLKEGCCFLEKPFNLITMARKIREVLDA